MDSILHPPLQLESRMDQGQLRLISKSHVFEQNTMSEKQKKIDVQSFPSINGSMRSNICEGGSGGALKGCGC